MCFFSSPSPPPTISMTSAQPPALGVAKAPLEAKKIKKKKDDEEKKPTQVQDIQTTALGIPTDYDSKVK